VLTKTCEKCDGDGAIQTVRDARLEDLNDAQVKTLLHADIYRETGGEEAQEQQQRAKRMQKSGSGGQPQARPTNQDGRSALSNRTPNATTPHVS